MRKCSTNYRQVSFVVMLVYCIEMGNDIIKLFSPPDSPIILVIQFHGGPSAATLNRGGVGQIHSF